MFEWKAELPQVRSRQDRPPTPASVAPNTSASATARARVRLKSGLKSRSALALSVLVSNLMIPCLFWPTISAAERRIDAPQSRLTTATQHDYLLRAQKYREAGDLRREQFELTNAPRVWPNSNLLRYTYALHLVRRKNLDEALVQTTHALGQDADQPATANLHVRLLNQLHRPAEGVAWVTDQLRLNRAAPPLEFWTPEWLTRWRSVLQLARKHAHVIKDNEAIKIIDYALHRQQVKPWHSGDRATDGRPTNTGGW